MVKCNDATECRLWVCGKGQIVGGINVYSDSHATGVGMLNNNASGLIELLNAFQRGICVGNIIERQFFALQLFGSGNAGFSWIGLRIKGCFLMGVFAVAHLLGFKILHIKRIRKIPLFIGSISSTKMVGNHAIIASSMFKGFNHQLVSGVVIQLAVIVLHFADHGLIVGRIDYNRHIFVIFGSRTNHGWATNIDVLNGCWQVTVGICHCRRKRIQVYHDHINWLYIMFLHNGVIGAATPQNPTVHFRVQGLYSAIHHLGEAGVIGHFGNGDIIFAQQAKSATSGQYLYAHLSQGAAKFYNAGFIGNTDQCAGNFS